MKEKLCLRPCYPQASEPPLNSVSQCQSSNTGPTPTQTHQHLNLFSSHPMSLLPLSLVLVELWQKCSFWVYLYSYNLWNNSWNNVSCWCSDHLFAGSINKPSCSQCSSQFCSVIKTLVVTWRDRWLFRAEEGILQTTSPRDNRICLLQLLTSLKNHWD